MPSSPPIVWFDGVLHLNRPLPDAVSDHMGLVLGISPTAYVESGLLLGRHVSILSRAASVLGYSAFDPASVMERLKTLDDGLWQVSLIPEPESHKAAPPGESWRLDIRRFTRPEEDEQDLKVGLSEFRRNETSPASSVLLVEDTELRVGASRDQSLDATLWVNLNGDAASIDQFAVFAQVDGVIVTPPLADGAPETAWRELLIGENAAIESSLDLETIRSAESLACVAPWGDVHAVSDFGDHCCASASVAQSLRNTLTMWRQNNR